MARSRIEMKATPGQSNRIMKSQKPPYSLQAALECKPTSFTSKICV